MIRRMMVMAAVAAGATIAPATAEAQMAKKDIVAVAAEAGSFKTLLAAAEAAGLVATLKGEGPLTVFAPTDEAFAKLPAGTVEALLKDPKKLAAILTYHVVPGKVVAADVIKAGNAKPATANGGSLNVRVMDGKVKVDGATVVKADVMASNGVIHVIDTVLLPPAK